MLLEVLLSYVLGMFDTRFNQFLKISFFEKVDQHHKLYMLIFQKFLATFHYSVRFSIRAWYSKTVFGSSDFQSTKYGISYMQNSLFDNL